MGGQRLTLASRLQVTRPRVGVGHTLQAERPDSGLANVGARWSGHQRQIRLRIERGHPGRRGCRDRGGGGGAERRSGRPNAAPCSLRLGCRSSAPPHGRPSFLSLFLSSVVSDMSRPGDMPFFCPVGVWGEDGPADASGCGQPSPGRLVVLHSSWPRGPAASRAAGAHGHTSPGAAGPPQLASMCLLRERGHLGSPEAELSVQGMVGAPWGPASGDQGVLSRSGQRPLWS